MSRSKLSELRVIVATIALTILVAAPASAQYFGRNKVNYQTFDFSVLKTEHFDIYYYPQEAEAIDQAARMAERWYTRLSRVLNHELDGRQPLIMYANHPHFEQTNAITGDLDESTGGVTESIKRRIVLPFSGSLAETDHVLGHELVHAFQYDIMGRSRAGGSVAMRMPLWFIEGMAEYLTLGPVDAHTAMWMRDAVRDEKELPDLAALAEYRYFPYRWGHSLWAYVGERWGDRAIGELLKTVSRGIEMDAAFSAVLGTPADSIARSWHQALRVQSERIGRIAPSELVKPLVASEGDRGRYNLAPSLSPDGRLVMFLSERDLFSIELYLADAHTGRILKRITRTAVDPHLQSLQFVSGSGSWSPDNRQFAFATIRHGRPVIHVINVPSGSTRRHYPVREVGEIWTLSWSPDGRQIAFSALAGGHTDLFSIDLASGAVRRWTNDLPADLQPAWSPDGTGIAFVSERYSSLETLEHGELQLALLKVEDGSIELLPKLPGAKHLNPQWAPDGWSIYCVASPDGISNIVRLDIETETWHQITNVGTGVSGLTATSPAFSVARTADRLVFAAYEAGAYGLFALDSLSRRGSPVSPAINRLGASIFPPDYADFEVTGTVHGIPESLQFVPPGSPPAAVNEPGMEPTDPDDPQSTPFSFTPERDTVDFRSRMEPVASERGEVQSLLADPSEGLVDTTGFEHGPYHASLSLDKVSQVGLGFGVGGGGVSGAGGATLYWSDMLGDQNLATFLQVSSDGGNFLNNVAAVVAYRNLRRRWNWGLELSQIPYLTRTLTYDIVELPGGGTGTREESALIWQVERRALGSVAYPFDRIRRIEFGGGYRNVGFESELTTRIYDSAGRLISETTGGFFANPEELHLGVGIVALVHDNSYFGGTSPVIGSRGRVELEAYAGDLTYNGFLFDLRHYVMPARPLTLAGRILHFGRYGDDAQSTLLSPLFLGYPTLVRGYDQESFRLEECDDPSGFSCEAWDRLFGSRIAVANVEARLPVFGPLGIVRSAMVPPIELAAFFDAGSAWSIGDEPTYRNGTRNIVTSHGVGMRVNLFGFLIAEMDLVHPNDRPVKGWYWQFSFQPGF